MDGTKPSSLPRLSELAELAEHDGAGAFSRRHLGPGPADRAAMLAELGYPSIDALVDAALPPAIRTSAEPQLPPPASEAEVLAELAELAGENETWTTLVGMGYHGTFTPPVIQRNVLESPAWYTAYTPYQPEISQGRLEALLNFQTMVSDLTGLAVANASMLDEASAAAEAMAMCRAASKASGTTFFVDRDCHPQTIEVVQTRAVPRGVTVVVGDPDGPELEAAAPFGVLVQHPSTSGEVRDLAPIAERAHELGALVVVAADLLALTLLVPPGELGADIAVGNTQRFGVPLWYGGPHAAYLATKTAYQRSLPGRLVGVSVDATGRSALRLALQAREQHIRRERATSNICTAQALLAVVAGMYAAWHGPDGLRAIAARVHRLAVILAEGLGRAGFDVEHERYFDTLSVMTGTRTDEVLAAAAAERINLRRLDQERVGVALDETSDARLVGRLLACFGSPDADVSELDAVATSPLGVGDLRTSPYLAHPVFSRYHSETEMLRYLRSLSDKDLALDRTMIPLGSCTMKLNATAEMAALSWPGFTDVHPFAPLEQTRGYRRLISQLEEFLCELSGYDAVSVQPNAGSQGELAGLLAIRDYHLERGELERSVCLIPTSAHGTNAASAAMAGMTVVPVACDASGNVDLADLQQKVAARGDRLAAIMLTYPSTHGVYEETVSEICATVHAAGGQVYIDGANFNALLGLALLAELGGDVSHFNLHKTFCIPHGGGGPGVGPIGVRAHLARFLPGSRALPGALPNASAGAVSGAPFGSPGVLPVSWAYIRMMGAEGLRDATCHAVLAANYVAKRLAGHFPVLYRGRHGLVAHECILDLREIAARTGVTNEDVAKRLVDYGFHAPTMSFPVAGTLMVEPTESESLVELDRFCEAMISIRAEIDEVSSGAIALEASPLRLAPHTAEALLDPSWDRPYAPERGAFPSVASRDRKYWPPVGRIDNAYGDRNLICTCLPIEAYAEEPSDVDAELAHGR
ncbi:MAG: glycine dehydrogenase [Acidimicrobiaceae bacterium]|nr:glycine dehydrogenase [Acidimicrobiaceae bacterium]